MEQPNIILCKEIKKSRCCKFTGCKKESSFNIKNENPLYCFDHKSENMINVKNKKCIHENCMKTVLYNFYGSKPLYCSEHKLDGMINTKDKKCYNNDCKKIALYNIKGKTSLYCFDHKRKNMIDIKNKTCIFKDCIIKPSYNIIGQKNPIYCVAHKKENMISVKNKKCIYENCLFTATYNIEGGSPIYCSNHKENCMINIYRKKCLYENCITIPCYNIDGRPDGIYCLEHKKPNMINVVGKICKTYLCYTQVTSKYDGYCLYCFIHLFPDKPISRNYKTKEKAVTDFILQNFNQYDWMMDKKVADGCSKRRPDALLDLGDKIIIVEIDENQHTDYSCENKRIMELSQDLDHRPITFIRFNPDSYIENNKKVSSCWRVDKTGICKINKKTEWSNRLNKLKDSISESIQNIPDKTIATVTLFYNTI